MKRNYELMYIVRPELDDEGVRDAVQSVRGIVEQNGGELVKTVLWGKRRLAYEVRRLRDGHYVLLVLRLDSEKVAPIERALSIHDTVFRHLLVLHEGPMPEADGEIEEIQPVAEAAEPNGAAGGPEGATVSAREAQTDTDEDELSAGPTPHEEKDNEKSRRRGDKTV